MRLTLYFDGAAFPNTPGGGVRGIGVVLDGPNGPVKEIAEKLPGLGSSNSAEYEAIIRGLEEARRLGCDEISIKGDSQLVIRQLEGKFRITSPNIRPLYERVAKLVGEFKDLQLQWIPREQNKRADALSTRVIRAEQAAAEKGEGKKERLGSSPAKREHDILCPTCRKPCRLTLQKTASGDEMIRQECPDHGFIAWAPKVEPFLTIARENTP